MHIYPLDKARVNHHMSHSKNISLDKSRAWVCNIDYHALPLESNNQNVFQNLFGIKYKNDNKYWIHSISSYISFSCFGLIKICKLKLAETMNLTSLLYKSCPSKTMYAILSSCYDRLLLVHDATLEVDKNTDDNQSKHQSITVPAASIFKILNGSTSMKLPTKSWWIEDYKSDSSCYNIIDMTKKTQVW